MKYCSDCKVLNEEDALVCKICGKKLDESTKTSTKNKIKKNRQRTKHKTKVKNNTKTKKVVKDNREKGRMNFFQKFLMFILINLCIALSLLCAYFGYQMYKADNIDVPNVIGYSYEEAKGLLKENNLDSIKIEKEVEDEDKIGIVIDQNKKHKAKENEAIRLTVGVKNTRVKMPDLTGLSKKEALNILNKMGIKYEIEYEEDDEEDTIIKQSIKAGDIVNQNSYVKLIISKKKVENITTTMEKED